MLPVIFWHTSRINTSRKGDHLVGHAGNSVTDMSFPPSSEQNRKATRIGYTGSFSNAGPAAVGTSVLTYYPRGPLALRNTRSSHTTQTLSACMVSKRKTGSLYLLVLWGLISALAWPAYVLCSTVLVMHGGEGWQLDAWSTLPRQEIVAHFLSGYKASMFITIPLGLIAVVDYLLLSRYRATWLIGGVLLPLTGVGIAFGFYQEPYAALPGLLATGILLAVLHRLVDVLAGQDSRGRLR
ncbi:MAG: hypothetical protein AB8B97_14285 [Granulosicoccus sp.]